MNELDMCEAMAKLEAVELSGVVMVSNCQSEWHAIDGSKYNPVTDLALNCALRDKYEIDIVYSINYMTAAHPKHNGFTEFDDKKDISRAVIECILKSNGIYCE